MNTYPEEWRKITAIAIREIADRVESGLFCSLNLRSYVTVAHPTISAEKPLERDFPEAEISVTIPEQCV